MWLKSLVLQVDKDIFDGHTAKMKIRDLVFEFVGGKGRNRGTMKLREIMYMSGDSKYLQKFHCLTFWAEIAETAGIPESGWIDPKHTEWLEFDPAKHLPTPCRLLFWHGEFRLE